MSIVVPSMAQVVVFMLFSFSFFACNSDLLGLLLFVIYLYLFIGQIILFLNQN